MPDLMLIMSGVFPHNLIFFNEHNGNFKEEETREWVFDVSNANVTHSRHYFPGEK